MKVTHSLIFVPYFTSAGVKNGIDLSTANLDSTYFNALTANTDRALRWRPLNVGKSLEEVDVNRAESMYKTYPSGRKFFVQNGAKTFQAKIPDAPAPFVKMFDSARCEKMGVYIVDRDGNLIGNAGTPGFLYPFRILDQSIDAYVTHPKDGEIQEVIFRFDFDSSEEDGDIGMIESDEMAYDVRLLTGIYDVKGVFTTITATGWILDLRTNYGTAKNPLRATGMVAGDFVLTNRATGSPITITSVTESTVTPGVYTFVIPSTPAAKLKLVATETGFDFHTLSTQVIITP